MADDIPTDAIRQLQAALRKHAKMSSYDPDDTPLPNLPSPEDTISELDPSPADLRCKHCQGRLLRGVASLTCVFCGADTDVAPEPINFCNTLGFRWLLASLSLTGSEIVDQSTDVNEFGRGQTAASKGELTLSELLSVELRWTSKGEKTPARPRSFLDLAVVNVESSFSEGEKDGDLSAPEEEFDPNKRMSTAEPFKQSSRIATTQSSDVKRSENHSLYASEEEFDPTKPAPTSMGDAYKGSENLSFFAFEPEKQVATPEKSVFKVSEDLSLFQSEKPFESTKQVTPTESSAFQGTEMNESLSLFENVQPFETTVQSAQAKGADSVSSWSFESSKQVNATESNFAQVNETFSLFENVQPSETIVQSAQAESADSVSSWSFESSKQVNATESNFAQVNETFSLFENVQPSETIVQSAQAESADSVSSWPASFQFAASANLTQESESVDPFVGSTVDLSVQIDTMFGSVEDLTKLDPIPSTSASNNWFSDDLFSISNSESAGQPRPVQPLAMEKDDNLHSTGVDWVGDAQWQPTNKEARDDKTADEEDDSFGDWNDFTSSGTVQNPSSSSNQIADQTSVTDMFNITNNSQADDSFGGWNDFTSSSNTQNPSGSSKQTVDQTLKTDFFSTTSNSQADDSFGAWNDFTSLSSAHNGSSSFQQNVNQIRPAGETSVTDLFSTATGSRDLEFGSFSQPDISAGASSSSHGSTVVNITQPEAFEFNWMADASTQAEDVMKDEGDVFSAKTGSKSDDVEEIMSKMHDLSFILDSNLSMPPKHDIHSLSEDHA